MKDFFANPARVLCGAVLGMIGTFAVAVWSTGALDAARPPTPEFRTTGEIARLKETCHETTVPVPARPSARPRGVGLRP